MDEEGFPRPSTGAQFIPVLEEDPLVNRITCNITHNNNNNHHIYNNNISSNHLHTHNCNNPSSNYDSHNYNNYNTHNNTSSNNYNNTSNSSIHNYNNNNTSNSSTNNNNTTAPPSRYLSTVDEESGEATGRKVMVLRTAPRREENNPLSELSFLEHSHALLYSHILHQSASITQKTLYLDRYSLTNTDFTLYQNARVSPYGMSGFDFQGVSASEGRKGEMKTRRFRVPVSYPEYKPCHKSNEVIISIRRELCRGPLVFEDNGLDWNAMRGERCHWPHLQVIFGDYAKLLPVFILLLVRAVLILLKIIIPWVGLQLIYFQLFYIHMEIHLTGKKKGLKPVFVGSASQGPMIYSIRNFSCPYCKLNREMRFSLRYMDSLREEIKNGDVR